MACHTPAELTIPQISLTGRLPPMEFQHPAAHPFIVISKAELREYLKTSSLETGF
jgi:hypothetical protein